jgi:hypothetical protein
VITENNEISLKKPALTPEAIQAMLENRYGPGFAQWFIDQLARHQSHAA